MKTLFFTIYGRPRAQGSKRAFGRIVPGVDPHHPRVAVTMVEQGKHTASWRNAVAAVAGKQGSAMLEGPVAVRVTLCFARPKSHYGSGRNAGRLKPEAPARPTSHFLGDIDKMLRALFDGISGILIRDDSQIVDVTAEKVYSDPERAEVLLTDLGKHSGRQDDPSGPVAVADAG